MDVAPISSNYQLPLPLSAPDGEGVQHVPPSRLFGVLLRRKWLILAIAALLSAPAALVIYTIVPYYDATALLMIDTRKSSFRDLQATVASPDADLVSIATQVGIIRSPSLAAKVVDRLNLSQEPEFAREIDPPPSLSQRITADVLTWLHQPVLTRAKPSAPEREQIAADILLGKLSALNDGKSYIISIRARTGSPQLSASIANAYIEVYLDFERQLKVTAVHRANSLLDDQIAPIAARVSRADQAVEAYRAKNGLIANRLANVGAADLGGGTTVADQQLVQINNQLITVSGELAQRQASLHQVESALRSGRLDAIPEVVSSALISSLRAQQAELSSRAASLGQNQMPGNPTLRAARAAASELQQRIDAEISNIASSVRHQVSASQAQVDALQAALTRLQGQVGTQSQANVTLRQLETEARAARAIYQDYLGRFEQTRNQSSLQEAEADQVSAAQVPIAKSGPPRTLYLALAVLVAAFLACLVALLVDRMRQGVRTAEQLEAQTGLFGMGFIPMAPGSLRRLFRSTRPTIYSESVSLVSNMLQFGRERYRARVVLITSAVPNEGKTVFAVSLAASVGREGGTALLVDCDMRRPSVIRVLGVKTRPEQSENAAILCQSVLPGVDVVTFRPVQKGARNMVSSSQIDNLLDEARLRYDMIVLDTPPVLPFADTPILSMKADGAIMVVRWRHTPAAVVTSAIKMLSAYGVRVLGGVVTQVRLKEVASADGGHAYMYRHYASYFR